MKTLFIVANWKAYKTIQETDKWFVEISNLKSQITNDKEVVVCPSFHLLTESKMLIEKNDLGVHLGAQDVSQFPQGAFTGDVSADQLTGLVTYTIIGHSERRTNFSESDEILQKKAQRAKEVGMEIIYCVQGVETSIPSEVSIVAYEPVEAIGSGHADTPEDAENVAKEIKEKNPQVQVILYGGSVTADNVHSFTSLASVDGVLVGGASLDPVSFVHIIKNA